MTINACKDLLKSFFRRHTVPLDAYVEELGAAQDHSEVLEAVLALPEKYRRVVYLHDYEGYTAPEIARILGTKENTVYTQLSRGRGMLRMCWEVRRDDEIERGLRRGARKRDAEDADGAGCGARDARGRSAAQRSAAFAGAWLWRCVCLWRRGWAATRSTTRRRRC